jgi:hypothetical protein
VAMALAPENTAQALGWLWDGLAMGVGLGTGVGVGAGQEPDTEVGVDMGVGLGVGRERFSSFRVVCPEYRCERTAGRPTYTTVRRWGDEPPRRLSCTGSRLE